MLISHSKAMGVFSYLIDQAAFMDKIVVDVRGVRRKRSAASITGNGNRAIGGPGRFYARCIPRRHEVSGNKLQLKYGVMKPYKSLSPFKVTIWANRSPVTCSDVLLVLDGFFRIGYKAVVSSVELTFDTSGVQLWQFQRDLCSRARKTEVGDGRGVPTVYVGGVRSGRELRIYEKSPSIVRVEFVLRSVFLRAHGIRRLQDLLLLKKVNLWRHVSFRKVNHDAGDSLPPRVREPWLQRGLALPPAMPACIVERELRDAGIQPGDWVVWSERQKLLRKMQRATIW